LGKICKIVNLFAFNTKEETQYEGVKNSVPDHYIRCICVPKIYGFKLNATVQAESTFMFLNSSVREPFE